MTAITMRLLRSKRGEKCGVLGAVASASIEKAQPCGDASCRSPIGLRMIVARVAAYEATDSAFESPMALTT